jgi:tetratricopeptide (TPR) repeat protein
VEKAVTLDPSSSDARAALAQLNFAEWKWRDAEEEFRRAIALNPNNANAHEGLCSYLDIMGRMDESVSECQLAQVLDPDYDHLSLTLEARRQYGRAVELLRNSAARHPDDGFLHYYLYRDYALLGEENESVHELEQSLTLTANSEIAAKVHRAFATSGYRGALREWAKDLEYMHATHQVFLPRLLAEVYAQLGEKDQAFYWLEQGYEHRDRIGSYGSIAVLQVEHQLDPLSSDPRYASLVRRIGLPQ